LAQNGLRFTQFYNTAKCHSSRVSLLSGLYCTQAGDESLSRATTIAEVLSQAGYFTSMTGKWHLHKEPTDFGFQRYWGHLSGATDFFHGDSTFRLNGEPWNDFDSTFYTTDANVDYSIQFLDEALTSGKPFFHYIAFNAPHYPLQAPRKDIKKYLGSYDHGWEAVRESRFLKQKQLGLFPDTLKLPPLPNHMMQWDSLTAGKQEFESFRMSVYAAMVDRVDQNIGRLVDFLEEKGGLENTLIMLCSDNGACPFERSRNMHIPPWEGGSFYLYDASWATVSNTPLKHYKQTQHEGGISSPLIVHWPGRIKNRGGWERTPGHLIDVMATCIDVSDAEYPENEEIEPLQGKSLLPLLVGDDREEHEELYFTFRNCRALRTGNWKLVSFYGSQWELYNIAEDRFEQNDLAGQYPEMVRELSSQWYELAEQKDRQPEKWRKPVSEQPSDVNHREWHRPELVEDWNSFNE
ncbi:MAG: arylsulfatase, partial [Bacteroidales bacterium]|nr:arylsulfatase [Bacteroidales bacterium]